MLKAKSSSMSLRAKKLKREIAKKVSGVAAWKKTYIQHTKN
jgi:hypothetical protein